MSYAILQDHFRKVSQIGDAMGILGWDQATMMPSGGAGGRTEQMTVLGGILHDMKTDPRIGDWLEASAQEELDEWSQANLREINRIHLHETALTSDLVEALTRATMKCEFAWRTARPANDYASVKPLLEEVIQLTREKANMVGEKLGKSPYDALVDEYEPGATSAELDIIFDEVAEFLPNLLSEVIEYQNAQEPIVSLNGPFAVETQRQIGLSVMKALGFDFNHGRLDVSHHPFCGGNPTDIRITTRYAVDDFTQSLMGVIHETGHVLYEGGLPRQWLGQPVGQSRSMGIHESHPHHGNAGLSK